MVSNLQDQEEQMRLYILVAKTVRRKNKHSMFLPLEEGNPTAIRISLMLHKQSTTSTFYHCPRTSLRPGFIILLYDLNKLLDFCEFQLHLL